MDTPTSCFRLLSAAMMMVVMMAMAVMMSITPRGRLCSQLPVAATTEQRQANRTGTLCSPLLPIPPPV